MKTRYWLVVCVVLLLITLPYLIAVLQGGEDYLFVGFLVNPIDGNSYLAKMQEGYSGDWLFTLPFTNDPGQGTPLFLFYIFLGQLTRMVSLPVIWMFHITRVACSAFLLWTLAKFTRMVFPNQPQRAWQAFVFSVICSGSGWVQLLTGTIPVDLWVAEAYPWMSMYANPHFPLGMAILLWIFMLGVKNPSIQRDLLLIVSSLSLAIVMPFAAVIGGIVLACRAGVDFIRTKMIEWRSAGALLVGGGFPVFYQFWLAQSTPQLASWNAQNITSSPGVQDIIISFSPLLLLAGYALWTYKKQLFGENLSIISIWMITGLILVFIPFSLQRRFLFGLFIPTACLAVVGMDNLVEIVKRLRKSVFGVLIGLSIPTVMLVLIIEYFGIASLSPEYYISFDEKAALTWIKDNSDRSSVILSSPEMGNFIPGQINRKVVYGHPFETPNAVQNKNLVEEFFQGDMDSEQLVSFLTEEDIQYVFIGPREVELGQKPIETHWGHEVYSSGDVTVYQVDRSK